VQATPRGFDSACLSRIVKILISHSEPISSSIDPGHPSRFFIVNRPTAQSTTYVVTGLSVRCQSPSTTHSRRGRPSHNLVAIDRDLVVNSRGVSVVVTQEPAQPLATLYSLVTTSSRDLRKQQDVGLPLMISLSVIMRNVFPHRSSQGTFAKENEL
jgi:hypothetical protein